MTKLSQIFAVVLALIMPLPSFALLDLETTPKSLYFAGRCMAPVLLREPISTKDLREMPATYATAHLYGKTGTVWHGDDDSVVLVVLDEGASCGVNVFDEDLDEVSAFMTYWLERDESPFDKTETVTRENGDVTISYDGFCDTCGFHVHARALWIKASNFTIYRVFATLPEKA